MPTVDVCVPEIQGGSARPLWSMASSGRASREIPRSTVRCNVWKGDPLFCELLNVQLGQHSIKMPPWRASCRWDKPVVTRLKLRKVLPWEYQSVRMPCTMNPPALGALTMERGKELHPHEGTAKEMPDTLTRMGFEELFNSVHINQTTTGPACGARDRLVDHPVVLVRRKDAFNPFHAHEMIFSVWSTFLALNLEPCETSILLSDLIDDSERFGPFLDFHRIAFAPVRGVEKVSTLSMLPYPTCFTRVVTTILSEHHFGIPFNHRWPLEKAPGSCGSSPYVIGFSNYVKASLGLYQPDVLPHSRQVAHVMLLHRQTYRREQHKQPFPTMREMANHLKLERELGNLCDGNHDVEHRCTLSIHDMSKLPIATQIALASATDVLVGTHSAAMTYLLYMPPHGCLVEFATPTDFHYDNLAQYAGICHIRFVPLGLTHHVLSYVIDVDHALRHVTQALRRVTPHLRKGLTPPSLPPTSPRNITWPQVFPPE